VHHPVKLSIFLLAGVLVCGATSSTLAQDKTADQHDSRFIPNDPTFADQWHLNNTGQSGGTAGQDLNVVETWGTASYDGYTGSGVVIGVLDSGIQYTHPDLAPNLWVNPGEIAGNGIDDDSNGYVDDVHGWDFGSNDNDPSPVVGPSGIETHGTRVAGVVAAAGNNGTGVSGVAPNATFVAMRRGGSDSRIADALTYENQTIDIYTNSWGPTDNGVLSGPGAATLASIEDAAQTGRGGLGSIFTWAGGNGGNGDNVNYDGYTNSRHTIAVGAIDHDGVRSSYSERGAPLLVVAPSNGDGVGITTTDVDSGYTNGFGGTSSATPKVAGVIALMLEANPNLTSRDVQHVLAKTARRNDAGDSDWTQNGAGHWVNHKYGFGAVDAAAAVDASLTWTTVAPEVTITTDTAIVDAALPDGPTGAAVTDTITVTENIVIEWVEVDIHVTHTYAADMEIILTAPSGTESILAMPHGVPNEPVWLERNTDIDWTYTSIRHLDEYSMGDWTLSLRDGQTLDTGTWDDWSLSFFGTPITVIPEPTTLSLILLTTPALLRRRRAA